MARRRYSRRSNTTWQDLKDRKVTKKTVFAASVLTAAAVGVVALGVTMWKRRAEAAAAEKAKATFYYGDGYW